MAVKVLYDADILIGGYRLSSDHNSIDLTISQDVVQVPPVFGDVARRVLPGPYSIRADGEGLYQANTSPQAVINTLRARIGVNQAADILTLGDTKADGDGAYCFKGVQEAFSHGGRHGEVNKFRVSSRGAYRYLPGTRMLIGQKTVAGNGVARQLGTVGATQSVIAVMHVYQFDGTDMTMIVQSDTAEGFPSPTTALSFSLANGIGAQWVEVAGLWSEDWWRMSWSGTFTSFSASVVVGIVETIG
jgi:hypothetical protein